MLAAGSHSNSRSCSRTRSRSRSRSRSCARARSRSFFRFLPDLARVRAYARVDQSESVSHSLTVRAFSRSLHRCGSCTRESCRCSRHSQDVSLSLWQCSDRATHLSTDAQPVSWAEEGGVLWRAVSLPLPFSRSRIRPLPSIRSPCRVRRVFSFPRSSLRLLRSTLRVSLRLQTRRTGHPAPREPIPTHVKAPTRDAGDDLRSRPNVAELPPPLRATTTLFQPLACPPPTHPH